MPERESLVAELWYAEAPDLDDPLLLEGLRAVSPGTQPQEGSLTVPYDGAELPAPVDPEPGNGRVVPPLVSVVLPGSTLGEGGKALPDTSQTWDWPDVDAALADARASVLVTEMFAGPYGSRDRAAALGSVVAALSAATAPLAVSWPTSQRVTDPAAPGEDSLGGLLNVRLFQVAGTADEESVMDTLGLAPFGLPDVQLHFRDLPVGRVAAWLHATGRYLFEAGDVVADGHTVSGLDGDEHWVCRHEDALLAPVRTVLDVDPGDPYAGGRRDR